MPQVTITGYATFLPTVRDAMAALVAGCAEEALSVRPGAVAYRFVALDAADLRAPQGRSERYTLVELQLFAGRTVAAKKAFYAALYAGCAERLGIGPSDLEIIVTERPAHDWAVRGRPGDEL
jgi:phenylpyruvate tautomerase PptA (4-oxalocrotonate tautomerase family)